MMKGCRAETQREGGGDFFPYHCICGFYNMCVSVLVHVCSFAIKKNQTCKGYGPLVTMNGGTHDPLLQIRVLQLYSPLCSIYL